jgi:prevent-host-death family protein
MYDIFKLVDFRGTYMKSISATELKTKTGETLDMVQREAVAIKKNGRSVAVIVPQADYEHLIKMEDAYLLARAKAAEKEGYLGVEQTAKFLKEMLKKHAKA